MDMAINIKVKALWKEEGRGHGLHDILYYRTIEDEEASDDRKV